MTLAEEGEPLAYDIAFSFAEEEPDLRALEARSREVAPKLRALALIVLLTRADVARFRGNLRAAAELRRDYLRAARQAASLQEAGREFAAGRAAGLFDALAAGAFELAREIVVLEPAEWRPDCEYEDDFCWARLVALALDADRPAGTQAPRLLERFESSLQGEASARLDLARALAQGDAAAFGQAFEALLEERGREIEERIEAGEMDDPLVLAARRVHVEGLALLALADARGWPTEREYLYCPSMARNGPGAGAAA
ncbi:MAG: immunity 49 family protein [Burkholderiales bacterium]|nr:immunity 49 family protein [Burkholderiales bacterium]